MAKATAKQPPFLETRCTQLLRYISKLRIPAFEKKILDCEKFLGKFRPRKVDFVETASPSSRREKYKFISTTIGKTWQNRTRKHRGIQNFEQNSHETKDKL